MDSGVIYVLKPAGMPSGGVVGRIKHLLNMKKVGHCGTLDPGAAGVLPVCFGRATRLSDHIMHTGKSYIAEMCCGMLTDTLDSYGKITAVCECDITKEQIEEVLPSFKGEQFQTAPAYSAVKIGGRASYKLARQGIVVEKPPRKVMIDDIKLLMQTDRNKFLLKVDCGSGTYIRTLLADIGAKLGVYAYTTFLMRTSAGGKKAEEAYTLEELEMASDRGMLEDCIVSSEEVLGSFDHIRIPAHREKAAKNGLETTVSCPDGYYRLYCGAEFLGLGEVKEGEARLAIPLWG